MSAGIFSTTVSSKSTYKIVREQVHGSTRPRINLKYLKSLTFMITDLEEQKGIVRRVESLFTMAETVKKQYQKAKQRADRLVNPIHTPQIF